MIVCDEKKKKREKEHTATKLNKMVFADEVKKKTLILCFKMVHHHSMPDLYQTTSKVCSVDMIQLQN
jgi:hypothetical protein